MAWGVLMPSIACGRRCRRAGASNQLERQQDQWGGVEKQVKDIQRTDQRALREHPPFLDQVWLRLDGSDGQPDSHEGQPFEGNAVKPGQRASSLMWGSGPAAVSDAVAHFWQMQALRRASAGTRPSNSSLKLIWVHQQGVSGETFPQAITQAFGSPHKGQRAGSGWAVGKGKGPDVTKDEPSAAGGLSSVSGWGPSRPRHGFWAPR